jgi:hypothetical protein
MNIIRYAKRLIKIVIRYPTRVIELNTVPKRLT